MPLKQKGVLLHFSSLPGDYGIGDFGPGALEFAQVIKDQGYDMWQVLPLNHRGYGNSPYNPISAFAIDPLLISPEQLYESGLIDAQDLEDAKIPHTDRVLFDAVQRKKTRLLDLAASRYQATHDINAFIKEHQSWLKPYIAFLTLDRLYEDVHWSQWQPRHQSYSEALWQHLIESFEPAMLAIASIQAIARDQLQRLKSQLDELKIELWGDLPIYLSYHSAEVWAHPQLFALDEKGQRQQVAGVPPDAFSEEGQLWGNPIYLWDSRRSEIFSLFEARIADALSFMNRLRLDHFIGYVNYWSVPCPPDAEGVSVMPENAIDGAWIKAPGDEFFARLTQRFGSSPFIAEDLGILTQEVCHIREKYGFPGMIVLQFCWQDPNPDIEHYPFDRIIYTGTHDNPTTRQWFEELPPDAEELKHFTDYALARPQLIPSHPPQKPKPTAQNAAQIMINIAQKSGCQIAIFPMQDLLGLDANARMNIPGTPLGNWEWRMGLMREGTQE